MVPAYYVMYVVGRWWFAGCDVWFVDSGYVYVGVICCVISVIGDLSFVVACLFLGVCDLRLGFILCVVFVLVCPLWCLCSGVCCFVLCLCRCVLFWVSIMCFCDVCGLLCVEHGLWCGVCSGL